MHTKNHPQDQEPTNVTKKHQIYSSRRGRKPIKMRITSSTRKTTELQSKCMWLGWFDAETEKDTLCLYLVSVALNSLTHQSTADKSWVVLVYRDKIACVVLVSVGWSWQTECLKMGLQLLLDSLVDNHYGVWTDTLGSEIASGLRDSEYDTWLLCC